MNKLNIAIVGAGISGLGAAWLLSKKHNVTLFERNSHLGGHANTVEVQALEECVPVDTGFIVYNEPNYPNLTALFAHLDVPNIDADMTFSMSLNEAAFEYSGTDLNGFFGQRRNILRSGHWRFLAEIARFFRSAETRILRYDEHISLGRFLAAENYSSTFIADHIIPMGAAIWSSDLDEMMEFPARAFVSFYANHAMLRFLRRAKWRTVKGGSREYVSRLIDDCGSDMTHLGAAKKVHRKHGAVMIEDEAGIVRRFDHVVMASHGDETLKLLADADPLELEHLSAFRYQKNMAVLHRDQSFMPQRRRLWSAWNYMKKGSGTNDRLCVTYWMNALQSLPTKTNYFVTLNPSEDIHPKMIDGTFEYDHPVFDAEAMAHQQQVWGLQGRNNTWFAGAYLGYGFHEDGLQTGLAVAEALGDVKRPWSVPNPNGRIAPHKSAEAAHQFLAAE